MNPEKLISSILREAVSVLYGQNPEESMLQTQATRKEFAGDITIVVFPLLKISKKSPEETSREIGEYLIANSNEIECYNVVKGFLNIKLSNNY